MRLAIHDQLQLPFDDADDLLVWMLMLWERCTGVDLNPRMGLAIGMNEAGAQAGKYFAHRQ